MTHTYLIKHTPQFKLMIFFLFIMSALTQAGLVLYTPAFLQISQAFHIAPALVQITLTAYLLGFGISQLFYGPLSDRWGRKKILIGSMFIFSLGCLWCIYASTYEGLFISRGIQGFGAGACMTLARAILRDCFNGKNYIYAASFLSAGFALGLGLSPVIGGHLLLYFPWQSEFICLLGCGIALLFGFIFFLPETHVPEEPKPSIGLFWQQTFKHCVRILKDRQFMCCLIGGVMAYGVVIAYTTMGPFLFQDTLGFSATAYGWLTFLIAIAYYASASTNRKLIHRFNPIQIMKLGLVLILIAGVLMLIPRVLFHSLNLYFIIIPLMIATYGQALIWSNTIALALQDLSKIAGTAAALFSCLQMMLSAALSAILAILSANNQLPLALTIIVLGLISWLMFYFSIFKKSYST